MNNPTDTNQDSELYELCNEVYKLTEWECGGEYVYHHNDLVDIIQGKPAGDYWENNWWFPLYTSDYLLEKLPKYVDHLSLSQNNKLTIDSSDGEKGKWYAHYWLRSRRLQVSSDTPLKALLKLCLALKEAGEI